MLQASSGRNKPVDICRIGVDGPDDDELLLLRLYQVKRQAVVVYRTA